MTAFYSSTVANAEAKTSGVVAITFTIPDTPRNDYAFRLGQYLMSETHLGGEELRRCYPVHHSRSPPEISVAVKATDGGCSSRYTQQGIQQGMMLEVTVPRGHSGY